MHGKSLLVFGAAIIASGVLLSAKAPAQSSPPPTKGQPNVATGDQTFIAQAAKDGMAEVELGKLAGEKASNANVKAFGQRMVTDHGKAGDELKILAASKQITLPMMVDPEHKPVGERLSKLSGAEFDGAYVREMVAGQATRVP
jgi:putative membrane protein